MVMNLGLGFSCPAVISFQKDFLGMEVGVGEEVRGSSRYTV